MHVIRFNSPSVDITVQTVEGGMELGGGHDDLVRGYNAGETPVARNGIAKNGKCVVEVEDQTPNSRTLAILMGLDSPVGQGNYTITIDGSIYAYAGLVDTNVIGDGLQLVEISWKGTVDPTVGPG